MPLLSVWMIRAGLVELGVGFLFGALLLANKGLNFDPTLWGLLPLHIELVLIGWTFQLAMGVAYWILPRFRDNGRGQAWLAWTAFGLVNAGVLTVCAGSWLGASHALALAGRVFEALAAGAFAAHAWPRVKPPGA